MISPASSIQPVAGRKYTLTHSDVTAELFLDIGYMYNYQAVDWKIRDEVLAEWNIDQQGFLVLIGAAYVDNGEFSEAQSSYRYNIFKKEMSTALKGMVYGDREFFTNYPTLLDSPIYISFQSIYPQFNQIFYYGTPIDYLS